MRKAEVYAESQMPSSMLANIYPYVASTCYQYIHVVAEGHQVALIGGTSVLSCDSVQHTECRCLGGLSGQQPANTICQWGHDDCLALQIPLGPANADVQHSSLEASCCHAHHAVKTAGSQPCNYLNQPLNYFSAKSKLSILDW